MWWAGLANGVVRQIRMLDRTTHASEFSTTPYHPSKFPTNTVLHRATLPALRVANAEPLVVLKLGLVEAWIPWIQLI